MRNLYCFHVFRAHPNIVVLLSKLLHISYNIIAYNTFMYVWLTQTVKMIDSMTMLKISFLITSEVVVILWMFFVAHIWWIISKIMSCLFVSNSTLIQIRLCLSIIKSRLSSYFIKQDDVLWDKLKIIQMQIVNTI